MQKIGTLVEPLTASLTDGTASHQGISQLDVLRPAGDGGLEFWPAHRELLPRLPSSRIVQFDGAGVSPNNTLEHVGPTLIQDNVEAKLIPRWPVQLVHISHVTPEPESHSRTKLVPLHPDEITRRWKER